LTLHALQRDLLHSVSMLSCSCNVASLCSTVTCSSATACARRATPSWACWPFLAHAHGWSWRSRCSASSRASALAVMQVATTVAQRIRCCSCSTAVTFSACTAVRLMAETLLPPYVHRDLWGQQRWSMRCRPLQRPMVQSLLQTGPTQVLG
jgi:hypothetical protein